MQFAGPGGEELVHRLQEEEEEGEVIHPLPPSGGEEELQVLRKEYTKGGFRREVLDMRSDVGADVGEVVSGTHY